jgi:hypothetical protein
MKETLPSDVHPVADFCIIGDRKRKEIRGPGKWTISRASDVSNWTRRAQTLKIFVEPVVVERSLADISTIELRDEHELANSKSSWTI